MPARRSDNAEHFDEIGILTFHCADNFGAMLQVYGLLTWLHREGFHAFVVNYVPPFLRGREWLCPYFPAPGKNLRGLIGYALNGLKRNVVAGMDWRSRKRQMGEFRRKYLTPVSPAFYRVKGLSRLKADILIVGSDQIWNPDITLGFRPAYFGAFENSRIRKTIAYAASFGTDALPEKAEAEFEKLLACVQEISMREKGAAEYIEKRFRRKAIHVVDPVFLLSAGEWRAIADAPKERSFILYYETEYNEPLRQAANGYAQKENLNVIYITSRGDERWGKFENAYSAGPAQFLGYISAADYVFTNSFHGVAFSILFHKPFWVQNHSRVGARIESLLTCAGLENRMKSAYSAPEIDEKIEWMDVERRLKPYREQGMEFLRDALTS